MKNPIIPTVVFLALTGAAAVAPAQDDWQTAATGEPSAVVQTVFQHLVDGDAEKAEPYFLGDKPQVRIQIGKIRQLIARLRENNVDPVFVPGFEVRDDDLALVALVFERSGDNMKEIDLVPLILVEDQWLMFLPIPIEELSSLQEQFSDDQIQRLSKLRTGQYDPEYKILNEQLAAEHKQRMNQPRDIAPESLSGVWTTVWGGNSFAGIRLQADQTGHFIRVARGNRLEDLSGTWSLHGHDLKLVAGAELLLTIHIEELTAGHLQGSITITGQETVAVVMDKSGSSSFEMFPEFDDRR